MDDLREKYPIDIDDSEEPTASAGPGIGHRSRCATPANLKMCRQVRRSHNAGAKAAPRRRAETKASG